MVDFCVQVENIYVLIMNLSQIEVFDTRNDDADMCLQIYIRYVWEVFICDEAQPRMREAKSLGTNQGQY